jgi:hypothetical protein
MSRTTWDALKLHGTDLLLKWTPGESRRLRVVDDTVYTLKRHWVSVQTESGEERERPFLCLGSECSRIVLPDGSKLHDARTDIEHRCFVWDYTLGGELRILMGKVQIFDGIAKLRKKYGDLALFDIDVTCEPAAGFGGRRYVVSATPNSSGPLPEAILQRVADEMEGLLEIIDPVPLDIDTVAARVGGTIEEAGQSDEERELASLAAAEPPPDEQ